LWTEQIFYVNDIKSVNFAYDKVW